MTTTTAPEDMVDHAVDDLAEPTADAAKDNVELTPNAATDMPTLIEVDPRTLAANPSNVRSNLGDLGPLTASIAAVGVLEPLLVIPDGDRNGDYLIVAGHRRNAAVTSSD